MKAQATNVSKGCVKTCPLSEITRRIVRHRDLLELYYHCKLCAEPHAYLEAEAFLDHVEAHHKHFLDTDEFEGENFSREGEYTYQYQEETEARYSADEGNKESREQSNLNQHGFEDEKKDKNDIELVIEWPEGHTEDGNTEEQRMRILEEIANKFIKQEAQSNSSQTVQNQATQPSNLNDQILVQEIAKEENEAHNSSQEYDDSQDMHVHIVHQPIEEAASITESAGSSRRLPDPESQEAAEQVQLYLDEDSFHYSQGKTEKLGSASRNMRRKKKYRGDPDFVPPAPELDPMDVFLSSQETTGVLHQHERKPGTVECWYCNRYYKRKHVASCKRPHSSEKPTCDAYVCVADKSEPVYPCTICQRIFLADFVLQSHLASEHEIENDVTRDAVLDPGTEEPLDELQVEFIMETDNPECYPCPRCNKLLRGDKQLELHLIRCKVPQIYRCKICSKEFNVKQNFVRHIQLHDDKLKAFQCEFCGKKFHTKNSMIIHTRNHTGEKPFQCEACPMRFKSKSHLDRHSYTHSEQKKYVCETCGKGYVDKSGLMRHLPVHTEEGKIPECHPCDVCQKVLRSKRQLQEHVLSFHSNKTPDELRKFQCDICNKRYRTKRNLITHKMIHAGNKPFVCKLCNKGFYKNSDLTIHMRIHTGVRPYKCEVCDRAFSNGSNLIKHRLIHTGERPYKCTFCSKSFCDPSHLTRHKKVHTGEKPFPCTMCDRAFATKQQMLNHMLVHSNIQPFMCGVCGKTFRQKAKAKRHQCLYGAMNQGYSGGERIQPVEYQLATAESQLVVEEAGEELSEQITFEQQGGEGYIVKVLDGNTETTQGYSDQIAVQVVDEHGQVLPDHVAYQFVDAARGGVEVAQDQV